MKKVFAVIALFIVIASFVINDEPKPVFIPPSEQRLGGDPQKGYEYLVTGDYVKGGIPLQFFMMGMGKAKKDFLNREGINKNISHEFTAVKARNGEVVIAPNCLQCHAQVFEDSLIIGLGNSFADFTRSMSVGFNIAENLMKTTAPKKYEASANFFKVGKTIGPHLTTEVIGVNAADRLAAVLVAHRDPVTLEWSDKPLMEIPKQVIPSDVPPWWLLKKKNAMFYNGFGRGDFGRFLMASNLLTVNDTIESEEVDSHMPDLLAYIYSLEAPKYPHAINKQLAAKGEFIFNDKCANCHGYYGKDESYPNLLIPQEIIQTDSLLYVSNYSNPQFVNWFNSSWFTKGDHPARLEPFKGYIAPPLDGIWASAPYLHNGSVPSLDAVLNSKLRPEFWSREFLTPQYDYEKIGWTYMEKDRASSQKVYNTTLPGYGNYGHYFGDKLNDKERKAVLEYLKTL